MNRVDILVFNFESSQVGVTVPARFLTRNANEPLESLRSDVRALAASLRHADPESEDRMHFGR